jgi:hypothetical protein
MDTKLGWIGRWLARAGAALALAGLAACGGGGGGDSTGGTGTLRVSMTDAPSCGYDHVWVTVDRVRVHRSATAADSDAGWTEIVLSPARRIDLLELQNGVLQELGSTPLEAGGYSQVRLVLAENSAGSPLANAVQPTGGTVIPLRTPSAQQSGLKLQVHFAVVANQVIDLVLDFDACKSVVKAGNSGNYNLKPVVSVTPKFTTSLQGFVATTLPLAQTTVSAQQGGVVVRSTSPDSTGRFNLAFLADGNYDIVITAEGRATMVITGVPASAATGITSLGTAATALTPPLSPMAEVSGTTSVTTSGTATALVTDASVRALQLLTGGPTIQVAATPVDADTAVYRLRLPTAAPVKAAYSTTAMTFAADTAVAGKYRLQAAAPGRTTIEAPLDFGSSSALTLNLVFAP